MLLVFFILSAIIFIVIVFIILLLSTIQIEFKNIKLENKKINDEKRLKPDYEIKIALYFLEKIPILFFRLDNKKINKISNSRPLENIDLKEIKNNIELNNKEIVEALKNIKIQILKFELNINIGTEDAILTSYIIAIIASAIGIILLHLAKENIKKCKYIVKPLYRDENEYRIYFNSIIRIKIVHIINSMLIFKKKGMSKNEPTSNRRSYDYRYE